jgi:hypothetical protein
MTLEEMERDFRQRLDAPPPAARAELLHVLMLPDSERADRIGEFWSYPQSRTFAELLIDCEEDRTLRAVLGRDAAGGRSPGLSWMEGPQSIMERVRGSFRAEARW